MNENPWPASCGQNSKSMILQVAIKFWETPDLSSKELKRIATKFVYHRSLMNKYWIALKNDVVKINKFKRSEKKEKPKKKGTPPSTIKHGW